MKILNLYIQKFLNTVSTKIKGDVLVISPKNINLESLIKVNASSVKVVINKNFLKTKFSKKFDTIVAINLINTTPDYEKAIKILHQNLKNNGHLLITALSGTDRKDNIWGFTMPSMHIIFNQYFSNKHSSFYVFGNPLSGRSLIEDKEINSQSQEKFESSDNHFSIIVCFVGKKIMNFKFKPHKHINILVDEEKSSIKGRVASLLKRTSYVLDTPINWVRAIRGFINRLLITPKLYLSKDEIYPVTRNYGYSRGKPIDRFYIEKFLEENKKYILGRCLEIVDNTYTQKFGGKRVTQSDALDIFPSQRANIQGDLRNLRNIPDNTYDCLVVTQTYFLIDDYLSAIRESYRILKPGGKLLATFSTMSPSWNVSINMWRFSKISVKYTLANIFGSKNVNVSDYGNSLSTLYFWLGFAQTDLSYNKLNSNSGSYPLIVGAVAKK